jgi:hypothetical protein
MAARRSTPGGRPRSMLLRSNGSQSRVRAPSRMARWVMVTPASPGSITCSNRSRAPGSFVSERYSSSGTTASTRKLPAGSLPGGLLLPVVPTSKGPSRRDHSTPSTDQSRQFETSTYRDHTSCFAAADFALCSNFQTTASAAPRLRSNSSPVDCTGATASACGSGESCRLVAATAASESGANLHNHAGLRYGRYWSNGCEIRLTRRLLEPVRDHWRVAARQRRSRPSSPFASRKGQRRARSPGRRPSSPHLNTSDARQE